MQKKSGIMKSGLDAIPLFLLDDLLRNLFLYLSPMRSLLQNCNPKETKVNWTVVRNSSKRLKILQNFHNVSKCNKRLKMAQNNSKGLRMSPMSKIVLYTEVLFQLISPFFRKI